MRRTSLGLGVALAALLVLPPTAGAAGTVTISGTNRAGDILTVTGTSTYTDQPFTVLGTDGTGDTFLPVQGPLGGDLVSASMATKANGQLLVRWTVNELPPVLNGAPTGLAYGFAFCVDGEASCFEVDAARAGLGAGRTEPTGALWRCADSSCAPADQTSTGQSPAVVIDAATKTITATVNHTWIGATAGSTLTPVPASPQGPAFVMVGDMTAFVFADFADGILEVEPFTMASKQVSVAVADAGLDPASVAYSSDVVPTSGGNFSAPVNVAGQSGERAVYVRACLGAGNCAFATQTITL